MNTALEDDLAALLRSKADEEIGKLASVVNADALAKAVIEKLSVKRDQMIWELLGISDKWGRWEMDHCNGRMGAVDSYLKEALKEQLMPWVAEQAKELLSSSKTEKIKNAVVKQVRDSIQYEYARDLRRAASEHLEHLAREEGRALAETIFAERVAQIAAETEGEPA